MSKNNQVEKIQLEYDLYRGRSVSSIEGAINALFLNLEEVDVARSYIALEEKRNARKRFLSSILGKHAARFGYLDPYYYDMDDSYLERKKDVLDSYYRQLNDIYGNIDENNFREMFRLMGFTRLKNKEFRVGIQSERDTFLALASNDTAEECKYVNEEDAFNAWFKGAVEVASYTESVEKVKK